MMKAIIFAHTARSLVSGKAGHLHLDSALVLYHLISSCLECHAGDSEKGQWSAVSRTSTVRSHDLC